MTKIIDLRSDTVTRPTPEMRKAMSTAEVGDDVYREDPTINRLESLSAQKLGKEAGLFIPSGTMGNLVALLAHCQRGDEIIMGDQAHTFVYEVGGVSALGGIMVRTLKNQTDGTIMLPDIEAAIRTDDIHFPPTTLIALENTHNRGGGVPVTAEYCGKVAQIAKQYKLKMHLDGARIFNASAKLEEDPADLAADFDSVTFCLSKGLGAPVGSVLCGSQPFIDRARKIRKQLGGGMRQAGILAAAGIVALEVMIDRLPEDHIRAKKLADGLLENKMIELRPGTPHTNMVFFDIKPEFHQTLGDLGKKLAQHGILIGGAGLYGYRLVTHYEITDKDIEYVLGVFQKLCI